MHLIFCFTNALQIVFKFLHVTGARILLQKADKAPDRYQWSFEIVRHGICETFQFSILGLQFLDDLLAAGFGPFSFLDLALSVRA